jgi:tetratricopeptide (TPR) repeat protein
MSTPPQIGGGAFARRYEALMHEARAGGPGAALAARRAAALALERDAERAEVALACAAEIDPLDGVSALALAQLRADRGDLRSAREEAARVFNGAVDESARALAAFALGELALARGDRAEARDAYQAARQLHEAILSRDPSDYDALRHLARADQRLADFTAAEFGPAEGRAAHGHALAILEALSQRDDALLDLAEDLAHGCARLAALCAELGDEDGAQRCAEARIGWTMRLVDGEPQVEIWRQNLADAWEARSAIDLAARRLRQGRDAIEHALRLRVALAAAAPGDARRRRALAKTWSRSAEIAALAGDLELAQASATQACALREPDQDALGARAMHDALILSGDIALKAQDVETARAAFSRACTTADAFAQVDATWRTPLAQAWERLGQVGNLSQRFASARDAFARARRLLEMSDPRIDARLALKEGQAALDAGDIAGARAAFAQSCSARLNLLDASPGDLTLARELAVSLERLGMLAKTAGDPKAARAAWEDELRLAEMLRAASPGEDATRFCAIVHAHLATLNGQDARAHAITASELLSELEAIGRLNERDVALRLQLGQGNAGRGANKKNRRK